MKIPITFEPFPEIPALFSWTLILKKVKVQLSLLSGNGKLVMSSDIERQFGPWQNQDEFLSDLARSHQKYKRIFWPVFLLNTFLMVAGITTFVMIIFFWNQQILVGAGIFAASVIVGAGMLGFGLVKAFGKMPHCPHCRSLFNQPDLVANSRLCDRCGQQVIAN